MNILKFFNPAYQYGFITDIEKDNFPYGLTENIISLLSKIKNDPIWLSKFRLESYKKWKKMVIPAWANLNIPPILFDQIFYYSGKKTKKESSLISEINPKILETFNKLGIPLSEQKRLTNVAIDAVFDSNSILTTYKEKLGKAGIIFCSISEAIQEYPELVYKYLGTVIPPGDNFFAALNSAVFSDGSFCYIPKNIKCPMELSTYFRINDKESGQFERTLIIAEKNSSVKYLEGCTAPQYDKNQLHAAIVELIAYDNADIEYSTIQNWYSGNENGFGGIYNFVTKRGICLGSNSKISWVQVEVGSAITWKYPSCILNGLNSVGKFYSITLTNFFQQADTGTKMIHLGNNTKSTIISKSISAGNSTNSYRGLVKISSTAYNARNFSECDSFLLNSSSHVCTYPYIECGNSTSIIEHEAKISKLSNEQLFYFLQRGLSKNKALELLVNGFCKDVLIKLPLEFADEANKLLTLKLEDGIG